MLFFNVFQFVHKGWCCVNLNICLYKYQLFLINTKKKKYKNTLFSIKFALVLIFFFKSIGTRLLYLIYIVLAVKNKLLLLVTLD